MGETLSFTGLEKHGLSALILALHHSLKPRNSPLLLQTRRFQFEDKATQALVNLPEYVAQTKPGLENTASRVTRTTNPSVLNPNQTQSARAPHVRAFRSSLDLLGNVPQLLGSTWGAARPGTSGSNRPETCPQATAASTRDFCGSLWPTQLWKNSSGSTDPALRRF